MSPRTEMTKGSPDRARERRAPGATTHRPRGERARAARPLHATLGNQWVQRLVARRPPSSGAIAARRARDADGRPASSDVRAALAAPGRPLDASTRAEMEARFATDLGAVRLHTGRGADRGARSIDALAFAAGHDVVLSRAAEALGGRERRRVLAHELTHVLQAGGARTPGPLTVAPARGAPEREAAAAADAVAAGRPAPAPARAAHAAAAHRISVGEWLARFFGGGTFPTEELEEYLRFLRDNDRIEDHFDSDNKARALVARWVQGDPRFILTARLKALLIQEVLTGWVAGDDQDAALALLRGSPASELPTILADGGRSRLERSLSRDRRRQLDGILATGLAGGAAAASGPEVFPAETVAGVRERFTSNAELAHDVRQNCILIVRELAPLLFGHDPDLAGRVARGLGRLRGSDLKMTEAGRVLVELGVATGPAVVRFNGRNGSDEPTAMLTSAWDEIIAQVGGEHGWHIFGMAVFNGYHSVTVFVDNRPDGPRVYWADQWAIAPGEDFHQAPGSVSGFRRYEREGFDRHINDITNRWWNGVHSATSDCGRRHPGNWDRACRWSASLKIWKFRTRPLRGGGR